MGNNQGENKERLRQIRDVLLRHDIVHGLSPVKLRLIIEDLGPTFVKLGQIMSMRSDMLPREYCQELTRLRAEVKPMPMDEVEAVLRAEYGADPRDVFAHFEQTPLGSASIAQAHRAHLQDGEEVVVKVQRLGVRDVMTRDIGLLRKAADLLKLASGPLDFQVILDEMWQVTQQEMDFLIEARNAQEFAQLNQDVAFVSCPRILTEYTTSRVLVMEYIDGIAIDDIEQLRRQGYETDEIASKLADNYVKQIIDDGFFHADPHPGNIRVRGGKIVWIDMGMMGRLTQRDRLLFRNGVGAVANSDVGELKDIVLTMGVHTGRINHTRLFEDIDNMLTTYGSMEMGQMDLGKMVEDLLVLAKNNGISMPKGVTMLSRGLMTLQGVLSVLSPQINMMEIVAARMSAEFLKQFDLNKELRDSGRALFLSGKKAIELPAQLSDVLKMTIKGQTKINLELTGSEEPLAMVARMVDRLIICIIVAALLIGSSLICTTDMHGKLFGIPALGTFGFLTALVLGVWLIFGIRIKRKR